LLLTDTVDLREAVDVDVPPASVDGAEATSEASWQRGVSSLSTSTAFPFPPTSAHERERRRPPTKVLNPDVEVMLFPVVADVVVVSGPFNRGIDRRTFRLSGEVTPAATLDPASPCVAVVFSASVGNLSFERLRSASA
jgi:hypothetical protein